MSLHLKAIIYYAFTFLMIVLKWPECLGLPSFRIIAPQTICKHANNGSLLSDPQAIVVGFQPRDGIKLSYKVRIFFKATPNRIKSQRNTLLIWKAVRSLESRVNVKERLKISQQNMISINKTELEPGVFYMFHAVGVTDSGEVSKEQIFTINFTDGVLELNDTVSGLNFLLIGAETTVASIPYLISARVSFCVPRYDYYLRWKMLGLDEEFQDILHTTGSILKIPPNSLVAGKEYKIQAFVIQSNNSQVLTQDLISVQVMKKGFQAYIIPSALKIGINKPAIFEIYIQDFDNNCDLLSIIWECSKNDGEKCGSFDEINNNSTKFELFFKYPGSYEVTATLKMGEITKSVRAEVAVDPMVYLSYEYSNIPTLVPSAGQSIHFSVLLVDLVPSCKAGWSTAQEEGFFYIPPDEIGDGFGTVEVKDLEKEYLSEIADFENTTVNKEIILNIPVASGKWNGLKGDSNYKFRLDTVCPGSYVPNDVQSVNRKVVSSFEFVVYTNSPPTGGVLKIKPTNGTALQTVFEISSDSAKDLLFDTPLSYEFFLQIEQFNISLGKYYEFKSLETQLPFSDSPIQIKSRVCDIRGACNTNFGPLLKVDSAEYSSSEIHLMETRIVKAFERTDFYNGQNLIFMTALTYKNSPNSEEIFNIFKVFATNLLRKEIDKQYESPTDKFYISKEDIINFISQTKINLEVLEVKDFMILEKLLDLLDLIGEENNEGPSANIEDFRRRKRDLDAILLPLEGKSIIDAGYVQMNLNLIEKLLQSYSSKKLQSEKAKIVQKIPQLAVKLCSSDLITKDSVYSSIAAINVDKMTGNHLLEKNFTITNYFTENTGHFRITMPALKSRSKYYCASFTQFPEDYFDGGKEATYRLQIIDLATLKSIEEFDTSNNGFVVEFKIPKMEETQNICLMRTDRWWSPDFCSTKVKTDSHVVCNCRFFGFLKIGAAERNDVTQPVSLPTFMTVSRKPPTLIIPSPHKNIVSSTNQVPTTETVTSPKPNLIPSIPIEDTTLKNMGPSDEIQDQYKEKTATASTLTYVLPFIGLLSILIVVGAVVLYKRRTRILSSSNLQGLDIMSAMPRESRPGLKYAKFYDEHLMTGNFQNAL